MANLLSLSKDNIFFKGNNFDDVIINAKGSRKKYFNNDIHLTPAPDLPEIFARRP